MLNKLIAITYIIELIKIYIMYICYRDLFLLFRKHGTILSVHTMINKTTGLSKGYGFISFAKQEEAKTAIEEMDGFRVIIYHIIYIYKVYY